MAQTGCLVVCGDAGEALGDSIYEARLYVRGSVASLGADCIEKEMRDEHLRAGRAACSPRRRSTPTRRSSAATARRASSTPSRSTTRRRTDVRNGHRRGQVRGQVPACGKRRGSLALMSVQDDAGVRSGVRPQDTSATDAERPWNLRESYLFDRTVIAEIQRAATEGIYDIRGFGAKRQASALRRPPLPRRVDLALPARGLSRAVRDRRRPRHALREEAARAEDPDHDRRDELRRALRAGEGGARPRRDGGRHVDDDRRRRDDARGARALEDARLPAPSLALRDESRRPAQGRRDRGRRRAGREARWRRDAPRPQDLRPRRRDALAAEGHRPALRVAPSRTGRGRTTSRSRSTSCARSPTGRSPSSSRSARRGRTTTSSSR